MPRGLGSLISFLAIPWLVQRFGARMVLFSGVILNVWSTWMMGQFDLSMTAEPIMLAGFIQGLGTGLMFAPLNTLAYATLDPSHRTEGTIVATMARSLGSSAGISVVSAMLIRDSALAPRSAGRPTCPPPTAHCSRPSWTRRTAWGCRSSTARWDAAGHDGQLRQCVQLDGR